MDRTVYWDERDMLNRLKRIEGQIRGLQELVRQRESCQTIRMQVAAAEGALQQVGRIIETCRVAEALLESNDLGGIEAETVRGKLKDVVRGR